VPDDRREVVESKLAAVFLNRCMERDYGVPAVVLSSREADISDHAD
jgi:hypothetical protein